MLYVSTRNRMDSYTAHRALHEDNAPDGGLYIPFRLPEFSKEDIQHLKERSFSDNMAMILNLFFSAKLTGWDVEFCCGRYFTKNVVLPHRIIISEAWHNTSSSYAYMEQALYAKLCGEKPEHKITGWARVAIYIAVLFAVYGASGAVHTADVVDLAVNADSFIAPTAAWYARKMGLPLGMIICGCYDSSAVWDLLHRGEMNTAAAVERFSGIERLICAALGHDETMRYVETCDKRRTYLVEEEKLAALNTGLFASVVSHGRIPTVVGSFYRSNGYVLDHNAAISYGALQDYRARTGESNHTLLLSVTSPIKESQSLTAVLGITESELEKTVNGLRG